MAAQLRVTEVARHDTGRWDQFVAGHPAATLYHDSRWREFIDEVYGHRTCYLLAMDPDGAVHGVLPLVQLKSLLFGNFTVSMPYFNYGGPLADSPAATRALVEAACERARDWNCSHLELRCGEPLDCGLPVRTSKVCMLLDLPDTTGLLWQSFGSKLRSQIKRPQRDGVTVEIGAAALLGEFHTVFARNMRDLGTPVTGVEFFRQVLRLFPAEAAIVIARLGGRPVAAALLLGHRGVMEIPWASSLREFNRTGVNMLLYWEALQHAVARGCRRFDFGRSTVDSGTFRFKQQWGAVPRQLYWNYWSRHPDRVPDLSPANPKYQLATRVWQRLPLAVTRWIGPRLARYLG